MQALLLLEVLTPLAVVGAPIVNNVMQGYNACCFAYGQTGAGKTHTMQGKLTAEPDGSPNTQLGLTPRVFQQIFQAIEAREGDDQGCQRQYTCQCSFLQIYNESISDLLAPGDKPLALRYDPSNNVYVENLSWKQVLNGVRLIAACLQVPLPLLHSPAWWPGQGMGQR